MTSLKHDEPFELAEAVNLRQLLATWVVHDLNQLDQVAKSLAARYRDAVGPWRPNLAILDR